MAELSSRLALHDLLIESMRTNPSERARAAAGKALILMGLVEWDEELHPRDEAGKFAGGGGGAPGMESDYLEHPGSIRDMEARLCLQSRLPMKPMSPDEIAGTPIIELQPVIEKCKDEAIRMTAENSGLSYETCDRVQRDWANSSNDTRANALHLQMRAAEKFGTPITDWQKEKMAAVEEQARITAISLRQGGLDDSQIEHDLSLPIYDVRSRLSDEDRDRYLGAVYSQTQKMFDDAGIGPDDEVTLYRGVGARTIEGVRGKKYAAGNPLESWSMSRKVGEFFVGVQGGVIEARVPRRHIVSTWRTGFGCLMEGEVVITGRPHRIVSVRNAYGKIISG